MDSLADGEPKPGEPRRFEGKVAKPGPFTIFATGDKKWVFEDKIGLKFDEGDVFIAVAVAEAAPEGCPEDLKAIPFVRLVVIR
jgi:hypothetical protein